VEGYEPRVSEYDAGGNYVGDGNGRAAWYRQAFTDILSADLPDEIFDRLPGAASQSKRIDPLWFPTRQAALQALAVAMHRANQTREG
jgi:radical SAM superfamily enzyme